MQATFGTLGTLGREFLFFLSRCPYSSVCVDVRVFDVTLVPVSSSVFQPPRVTCLVCVPDRFVRFPSCLSVPDPLKIGSFSFLFLLVFFLFSFFFLRQTTRKVVGMVVPATDFL